MSHYLGVFEDTHRCFIQMGVTYTNDEAIFDLLQGLSDVIKWQIFKEFTMNHMSSATRSTTTSSTVTPLNFKSHQALHQESQCHCWQMKTGWVRIRIC